MAGSAAVRVFAALVVLWKGAGAAWTGQELEALSTRSSLNLLICTMNVEWVNHGQYADCLRGDCLLWVSNAVFGGKTENMQWIVFPLHQEGWKGCIPDGGVHVMQ